MLPMFGWLQSALSGARRFADRLDAWLGGARTKSKGEKQLLKLFPGYGGGSFQSWTGNRAELANHLKGANGVAIQAICEDVACMDPQVARVRPAEDVAALERQTKALPRSERKAALAALRAKYVSRRVRRKSLATVQDSDELEPVGTTHELVRLLRNPNGPDVQWSFFYRVMMFLELIGNTYIWVVKDGTGKPRELWPIPAHWVRHRPGKGKIVEAYQIRPMFGFQALDWGGGWFPGGGGEFEVPEEDMIWISYPSPINPFDGYSKLTAAAAWIDISERIDDSRVAHFVNGMFPGVVVELDKDMHEDPSAATIERLQADLAARYTGVRRTNKPVILAPGMTLRPFTNSAVDMDYVQGANQVGDWQLASHRMGKSVIGMAENTTFASMVASRANYYSSTLRPKLVLIGQVLTERLARPHYGDDIVVYWQDAAPDDPDMRLRENQTLASMGAKTINEVRQEYGLESYAHGGDDPLVPMGLSELPLNTGQDPADMPIPATASERWDEDDQGTAPGFGGGKQAGGGGEGGGGDAMGDAMRQLGNTTPKSVNRIRNAVRRLALTTPGTNGRLLKSAAWREDEHDRATDGTFGEGAGRGGGAAKPAANSASGVKIKTSEKRAFEGKQVAVKNKLGKQAAGKLGEDIIVAHLKEIGMADARAMNLDRNNFPIDLIQDHEVIEGKTGQAGNSAGAQQWRLTIGEPGKAEKAAIAKMTSDQKAAWHAKKQAAIHDRKAKVLEELSAKLGHTVKASTITVILNPDTKTADIYKFDGWHDRIGWNSDQAKDGYVRSVTYE